MGEARVRGTKEERVKEAIARRGQDLVKEIYGDDSLDIKLLRQGLGLFMEYLSKEEWSDRRDLIINELLETQRHAELAKTEVQKVKSDVMGWYLFLCDQTINDPICVQDSQAQRILPFFAALGRKIAYKSKIKNLEEKIKILVHSHNKEPDGIFFELLVAFSYAEAGWDVEFLEEGERKTPDLFVKRGDQEFFVECKRLTRGQGYTGTERDDFLKLWDKLSPALYENRQWLWLDATFYVKPQSLPENYLLEASKSFLPVKSGGKHEVWNDGKVSIYARQLNGNKINNYLDSNGVKYLSAKMIEVISGERRAFDETPTTLLCSIEKYSEYQGGVLSVLGRYVNRLGFACGMTRSIVSEESIRIKARDVKKVLSEAIKQLPKDRPSIVHIGIEATDGFAVEKARNDKLREIANFDFDNRAISLVRLHRFVPLASADLLYDFIETKDDLYVQKQASDLIPTFIVAPDCSTQPGSYWGCV